MITSINEWRKINESETIQISYVVDGSGNVKNLSKNKEDAHTFLSKSLKNVGKVLTKDVLKSDWDKEKVTVSTIKTYKITESHGFRDYDNSVRTEAKNNAEGWLEEYMIEVFPHADVQMDADNDNDGDFVFGEVTLDQDAFNSWVANHDENIYNLKNAAYEFVDSSVNFDDTNLTVTYYVYY